MSFISWFLFVVFGGIGLAALPLDMIYDFVTRPKKLTTIEMEYQKKRIIDDGKILKDLALETKTMEERGAKKNSIFNSDRRKYNSLLRKLKAGVEILDKQYRMILIQNDLNDKWVCQYWFLLLIGIITMIVTLAWVAQILCTFVILKNGQAIYPLISNLLLYFQNHSVSFLSYLFFGLFCLYLLWATVKGNTKFGLRVLICWALHPMKKNETYMNSFLFNVMLILLCSVSVTQFCAAAFSEYATNTDIELIFTVQIRYLVFFVYFFRYHVFEYSLLVR